MRTHTYAHTQASALLSAAAHLVRQFPSLFSECVLAVARKTDAQLWPSLFNAVGPPSLLLEDLLEMGALASAACFLLVIDRCSVDVAVGLWECMWVWACVWVSVFGWGVGGCM